MATKIVTAIKQVDDDGAYRVQREKWVTLQLRRDELAKALDSLRTEKALAGGRRELDVAAAALLRDESAATIDDDETQQTIEAMTRELKIVRRALELHKVTLDAAREKTALEIRTSVVGQHRALGRRIAAAMTELRGALLAENDFRTELDVAGVGIGEPMVSLAFPIIGQPYDVEGHYWSIARWLRATQEYLGE